MRQTNSRASALGAHYVWRADRRALPDWPFGSFASDAKRVRFRTGHPSFDEYAGCDYSHRKQWIIDRLQFLSAAFAIDICAYAVMSNHYHLVLHVDQLRAASFIEIEVIERWSRIFRVPTIVRRWKEGIAGETETMAALKLVELWRTRLMDVSWFMRCLNVEHIDRELWRSLRLLRRAIRFSDDEEWIPASVTNATNGSPAGEIPVDEDDGKC